MLGFWIISSIVCIVITIIVSGAMSADIKKIYTLDVQRIRADKNIFKTIMEFLKMCIPILNIIVVFAMIFSYEELKDKIIQFYKTKKYIIE